MTRKRVRFAANTSTIPYSGEIPQKSPWMSKKRLLKISKEMNATARSLQKDGLTTKLAGVFDEKWSAKGRVNYLVELNRRNQEIRGIERHVSARHMQSLLLLRNETVAAVLEAQRVSKDAGMQGDDCILQERLAKISEQNSHRLKVFSRLLALADKHIVDELATKENERKPRSKSESIINGSQSILQLMKFGSPRTSWTSYASTRQDHSVSLLAQSA